VENMLRGPTISNIKVVVPKEEEEGGGGGG